MPKETKAKLRVSSHSTDYTLVSEFKTEKDAQAARKEILRKRSQCFAGASQADLEVSGRMLLVEVYTSYERPTEILEILEKHGAATPWHLEQEYFRIIVNLPKKVNVELAQILLPIEQAQALQVLLKTCKVTTRVVKGVTQLSFKPKEHDDVVSMRRGLGNGAITVGDFINDAKINRKWKNWKTTRIPSKAILVKCQRLET